MRIYLQHRKAAGILFFLLLIAGSAQGQSARIAGRVVDPGNGDGVAGANIFLRGTFIGTVTAGDGSFSIENVPPGRYTVVASCIGFERKETEPFSVDRDAEIALLVELRASPILVEPVVVTAGKREQSLQEIPVSVSLMERQFISDHNFPSVEDALRYVPGLNLVDTQVSIRGSSGYSCGADSRVLMLIDGIPLLTGDTGELNFETIPVGQVDRVEVTKGAGSALYGSNALGGVLNVTTRPITEVPQTIIRLYGGVFGSPSYSRWDWGGGKRFTDGVQLSHSRKLGKTGLVLHGATSGDEGYRRNDNLRRYNGYAKIRHDFSGTSALTGTFNILHQNRDSFLNWKDVDNALVPPNIQLGDWVRSTRFFVSTQYHEIISENMATRVAAIWYRNLFKDNIDTVTHRSLSDMIRLEGQGTWSPSTAQIITFGVEGNIEIVDADLFGKRNGSGIAAYAQDEIDLTPSAVLTLGARFDHQDLDSLEAESELSPKAGLSYAPWDGTRLRASAGKGFRSPTTAEAFVTTTLSVITIVPNPALKPERSYSYEVGLNQFLGQNVLFDIAFFRTDFSNLIEPRFVSGTTGQFMNVTEARIEGIETGLSAGLFSRVLFLNLSYTYINPRDLTADDVLKYRHRHLLYGSAVLRNGGWTAGVDFRYLSRVEKIDEEFAAVIPDADERVPIYVTDVRLGYTFPAWEKPLTVLLNVKNLFQYNYVEFIGNLAPPREISIVAEVTL